MAALAVVADPLVRCLLTDKWAPCVPYLQVLSIAGMLYPLHVLHLNVLTAQGRSDLFLRLEIIKKVFIVLAIVCTFRFGVSAMVWGILVIAVVLPGRQWLLHPQALELPLARAGSGPGSQ